MSGCFFSCFPPGSSISSWPLWNTWDHSFDLREDLLLEICLELRAHEVQQDVDRESPWTFFFPKKLGKLVGRSVFCLRFEVWSLGKLHDSSMLLGVTRIFELLDFCILMYSVEWFIYGLFGNPVDASGYTPPSQDKTCEMTFFAPFISFYHLKLQPILLLVEIGSISSGSFCGSLLSRTFWLKSCAAIQRSICSGSLRQISSFGPTCYVNS